ncbi:hypothetical protein [Streptomyces sp. NPDC101166]|uniref:hypothetical protein n=1 Tax=Streptomyces sp. NPDC101166 TaxID=3366120 RepID=UPI00381CEFEB
MDLVTKTIFVRACCLASLRKYARHTCRAPNGLCTSTTWFLSVGAQCRTPEATLAVAVGVLVAAARDRHGDQAVLHALARRERDAGQALHVLQEARPLPSAAAG